MLYWLNFRKGLYQDELTPRPVIMKQETFGKIDARSITVEELNTELSCKKVCMVIHGFNNEVEEVEEAYKILLQKYEHVYDEFVLITWPSGSNIFEFDAAQKRVFHVAKQLAMVLLHINFKMDVIAHSLGCDLILRTLWELCYEEYKHHFYNIFLMAPAVPHDLIDELQLNHISKMVSHTFILFSENDGILKAAWKLKEGSEALGYKGPATNTFLNNTTQWSLVDCTKSIDSHGAYKRTEIITKFVWGRVNTSMRSDMFYYI